MSSIFLPQTATNEWLHRFDEAPATALSEYTREHPTFFVENVLKANLYQEYWTIQADIINSVFRNRYTAVYAAHNVGKTFTAAQLVPTFLYAYPNSRVVTFAPTFMQVRELLWAEINESVSNASEMLGVNCLDTKLEFGENWYALGLSGDKSVGKNERQGFHAKGGILIIIDESQGVIKNIWDTMKTFMGSGNAHCLAIGNPKAKKGEFYRTKVQPHRWNQITISIYDHPNIKYKREIIPGAITMAGLEELLEDFPEGTPEHTNKVLGDFSDEPDENQLISLKMLEDCGDPHDGLDDINGVGQDIARYGGDKNVALVLKGGMVCRIKSWTETDTMTTAGKMAQFQESCGIPWERFHMDILNMGAGVYDRHRELGRRLEGVNFAEKSADDYRALHGKKSKFKNRRAELYWTLRILMMQKKLCIPRKFGMLWEELTEIQYFYTSNNEIQIEKKEDIKKRLGRSPDHADALVLALSRKVLLNKRKAKALGNKRRFSDADWHMR